MNGRKAIAEYDIAAKKLGAPIFANERYDADEIEEDRLTHAPLAIHFVGEKRERFFLDAYHRVEMNALSKALGGFVRVIDQSEDKRWALVTYASDTRPPAYALFDRKNKVFDELPATFPGLAGAKLSPWQFVTYKARDGREIPAYLTLPPNGDANNQPLIVLVHGGPFGVRVEPSWDPEVQFLASRGFAVLQPNFRGSGGYGREFEKAGYRQYGLAKQDDLTDAAKRAMAQGIADPRRVGIYGGSYGGYASLMAVVKERALFKAAAAYAAITSIPGLMADDSWYLFADDWNEHRFSTDKDALRAVSPLENVAHISAPVLLGHGENDWRIHVKHPRRFAQVMREQGKRIEYLEFPSEVHGFVLEVSRLRWYAALAAFFERYPAAAPASAAE